MAGEQLAKHAGAVARELFGEPNKGLSSKTELRFGKNGSKSVDLKKGTFFDHEAEEGGGVLWAIEREIGLKGRDAFSWLAERGLHVDDDDDDRGDRRAGSARRADDNRPPFDPDAYGDDRGYGARADDGPRFEVVRTWDYLDEGGELIFQVCRLENGEKGKDGKPIKSYRQRRPYKDSWAWGVREGEYFRSSRNGEWYPSKEPGSGPTVHLPNVRLVPYRLPELTEALASGFRVFVVEGEKCADRLWELGVPATTNAGGAGKWPEEFAEIFAGADVVVIPDNDPQATRKDGSPKFHDDGRPVFVGKDHAEDVARNLHPEAKRVAILDLPDLPLKGDAFDWVERGGTAERLFDLAMAAKPFEPAPYRSRFHAVTWGDLDAPGPEHEWLIKGVITKGELSMMAGASKAGKSFLTVDMAMAVARGIEWMGKKTEQCGVIYQAGEGARGLKKRLRAYRKNHGLTPKDDVPFVLLPSRLDLFGSDDPTDAFITECRHWSKTFSTPLGLIVVDTWAKATPGANENDGKDVSLVLDRCQHISNATGAHVMLVHHMNADGTKLRGHTSLVGNLENVIIVRRLDGHHDADKRQVREAVIDKQKDGEDGARFRFVLAAVEIGLDADNEPITSCVVQKVNNGALGDVDTDKAVGVNLSPQCAALLRAIHDVVGDFGAAAPAGIQLPSDVKVVEWTKVRERFERLTFEGDDQADPAKRTAAIQKALKRHGELLFQRKIIGRDRAGGKAYVWLTGKRVKGFSYQRAQAPAAPLPLDDDPVNVLF